MIRAIALDDEILALKIIESYANSIDNLSLEKVFNKQSDAQKYLNKYPVDLLFLDIEMPTKNGLEFYKSISQDTKVIFTTAYSHYAVDAFDVNAVDYLLKPFSFERFAAAVAKVTENTQNEDAKYLSIRANYKLHKIDFDDIIYIEGLDDYIQIHLKNSPKITARFSMKNILEKLPNNQFIRTHRSFIVPIKSIKTLVNKNIQIGEYNIPVGDTYKSDILKLLQQ